MPVDAKNVNVRYFSSSHLNSCFPREYILNLMQLGAEERVRVLLSVDTQTSLMEWGLHVPCKSTQGASPLQVSCKSHLHCTVPLSFKATASGLESCMWISISLLCRDLILSIVPAEPPVRTPEKMLYWLHLLNHSAPMKVHRMCVL